MDDELRPMWRPTRYKTHFPKTTTKQQSACGKHAAGVHITCDFRNITCRKCKEDPTYIEALYRFEIGEYSWDEWKELYNEKTLPTWANATATARPVETWEEHVKRKEQKRADAKALLAKFEARRKRGR